MKGFQKEKIQGLSLTKKIPLFPGLSVLSKLLFQCNPVCISDKLDFATCMNMCIFSIMGVASAE